MHIQIVSPKNKNTAGSLHSFLARRICAARKALAIETARRQCAKYNETRNVFHSLYPNTDEHFLFSYVSETEQ